MSCPLCKKVHDYPIGDALKRLAATGRRLEKLFSKPTAKRISARPAPGKWSPKEILCHLTDCEIVYGLRYRKIVSEPGGALVAFDQEAWARSLNYREQPVKQAMGTFKVIRDGNLNLLKSLPKSAWNKAGKHPDYGPLTLRQIVIHIADHDKNHLAQMERLLQK